jgi:hypothetical protein
VHTEFEDDFFEEPEQEEKRQETETERFEKGDMSDPSPFCGEECELQYSSCCEYCERDSPSDDDARSSAGSATTAGGGTTAGVAVSKTSLAHKKKWRGVAARTWSAEMNTNFPHYWNSCCEAGKNADLPKLRRCPTHPEPPEPP